MNKVHSIDQVVRREELERQYGDRVSFTFAGGTHRATVRLEDATHEIAERELRAVLDRAERLLDDSQ